MGARAGWRRTGVRRFGPRPCTRASARRVTRLFLAGRTVVRKEPLGPDAAAGAA